MASHFFGYLSRMKYINRWSLMRNSRAENLCEHSLEVAVVAHALAVLSTERLGREVDAGRLALYALYHDCSEILTGDLPTPVKYQNPEIREAYKRLESLAGGRLVAMLPEDLRESYRPYFQPPADTYERRLLAAADKISALIKCVQEEKTGNREFTRAKQTLLEAVHAMKLPAAEMFLAEFLPAYSLTLDELDETPPNQGIHTKTEK